VIDWTWVADHLDAIAFRTVQHVYLTAIAVAVGLVVSFGLAVWSVRRRRVRAPVAAVSAILYTIPSLAIFAAFVSITGISLLTAEIPLVMYTLVILVGNITAGLDGVSRDVLEAADGMGYPPWRRLWRVEVPLAIPLIVAGLRLATVSTIGLVTVTAVLGDRFGGLGYFVLDGWHRYFPTEIYVGGLLSVMLAVTADLAFVRMQRRITPWARARATDAR
jgi:osmoprotectant transport system permease protein